MVFKHFLKADGNSVLVFVLVCAKNGFSTFVK